jgi:hypothetical protein
VRNGTTILYTDFQVNERLNILNFLDVRSGIAPDITLIAVGLSGFVSYFADQCSVGFEGTDPTEQSGNSSGLDLGNGLIKNQSVFFI